MTEQKDLRDISGFNQAQMRRHENDKTLKNLSYAVEDFLANIEGHIDHHAYRDYPDLGKAREQLDTILEKAQEVLTCETVKFNGEKNEERNIPF